MYKYCKTKPPLNCVCHTCLKNKGSSHTHWKEQHSKTEVHNKVLSSITPLQQPSTHTICACSLRRSLLSPCRLLTRTSFIVKRPLGHRLANHVLQQCNCGVDNADGETKVAKKGWYNNYWPPVNKKHQECTNS
jgi:hypothetical protein